MGDQKWGEDTPYSLGLWISSVISTYLKMGTLSGGATSIPLVDPVPVEAGLEKVPIHTDRQVSRSLGLHVRTQLPEGQWFTGDTPAPHCLGFDLRINSLFPLQYHGGGPTGLLKKATESLKSPSTCPKMAGKRGARR
jgi:hypothetical protein